MDSVACYNPCTCQVLLQAKGCGPPEMVSCGTDGCVRVWDVRQEDQPVASFEPQKGSQVRANCLMDLFLSRAQTVNKPIHSHFAAWFCSWHISCVEHSQKHKANSTTEAGLLKYMHGKVCLAPRPCCLLCDPCQLCGVLAWQASDRVLTNSALQACLVAVGEGLLVCSFW